MARTGFLPGDDPRLSSTIDAIRTELGVQGPLLYRYSGMAQQEGGFLACSFWFSKATGRMLREGLGKVHFWLWFIGTNLTFLPMFWLGFHGMPRRIPTYQRRVHRREPHLLDRRRPAGAGCHGVHAERSGIAGAPALRRPRSVGGAHAGVGDILAAADVQLQPALPGSSGAQLRPLLDLRKEREQAQVGVR